MFQVELVEILAFRKERTEKLESGAPEVEYQRQSCVLLQAAYWNLKMSHYWTICSNQPPHQQYLREFANLAHGGSVLSSPGYGTIR